MRSKYKKIMLNVHIILHIQRKVSSFFN